MKSVLELFEIRNADNAEASVAEIVLDIARNAGQNWVRMQPELAAKILENINFPDQRKLKTGRRQDHLDRIKDGSWINGASTISFAVTPDGRLWLVDGQHRLSAIAKAGRAVGLKINIVEVKSFDEVRRLYATFDMKTAARNTGELIDASGLVDQTGLKRKIIRAVYNAAPFIASDLEPVSPTLGSTGVRSHQVRLDVLSDWEKEAQSVQEIACTAQASLQSKLLRASTASVMMYTLRYQPSKAREFWLGLARNDGLRRLDPRSTLIEDMMTRRLTSGAVRQSLQQPAGAWNAFYQGRTLQYIRCVDSNPITIMGTPLARRRK